MLLLAHIDVVEAKREDWDRDPFQLVEEDGWFYARGASDDKAMAAVFTDTLIRYRHEGFKPARGIKLALTCGEETPDVFDRVHWLVQTQPQVLNAAFALNEGAGGELDQNGRTVALQIQAGEKVYQDFALEATDSGGHSSRPNKNNPILRLSAGLAKLGAYDFPIALNPATRGYFEAESRLVEPDAAADMRAVLKSPPDEAAAQRLWARNPAWNGALRTTCVVTQIDGGHAPNALPQHVRANVNCRILPGVPIAGVQRQIVSVIGDEKITVAPTGDPGIQSRAPALTEAIMDPVAKVAERIWPGVAIVPTMSTGATDGRFLNAIGIPTYGRVRAARRITGVTWITFTSDAGFYDSLQEYPCPIPSRSYARCFRAAARTSAAGSSTIPAAMESGSQPARTMRPMSPFPPNCRFSRMKLGLRNRLRTQPRNTADSEGAAGRLAQGSTDPAARLRVRPDP